MSEKKVGKRLLTWVLVLVMTLSLLPLNVLAANPAVMRIVRPDKVRQRIHHRIDLTIFHTCGAICRNIS